MEKGQEQPQKEKEYEEEDRKHVELKKECNACNLLLDDSSSSSLLGKRKRKTERDLHFLRQELKKEYLWDRDKILSIAAKLDLNET